MYFPLELFSNSGRGKKSCHGRSTVASVSSVYHTDRPPPVARGAMRVMRRVARVPLRPSAETSSTRTGRLISAAFSAVDSVRINPAKL